MSPKGDEFLERKGMLGDGVNGRRMDLCWLMMWRVENLKKSKQAKYCEFLFAAFLFGPEKSRTNQLPESMIYGHVARVYIFGL